MSTDAASVEAVPRNPSAFSPTIHAGQRAKERDIEWERVAAAIEDGEIRGTHEAHTRLFVEDAPGDSVGAVVDVTSGEILTVGWYD